MLANPTENTNCNTGKTPNRILYSMTKAAINALNNGLGLQAAPPGNSNPYFLSEISKNTSTGFAGGCHLGV